jgi:uncharacterized MAPEG superfamily protein
VDVKTLNRLSLGYVASRLAYTVVYVQLQENRVAAPVRSVCWVAGLALSTTLFICAGNKFAV